MQGVFLPRPKSSGAPEGKGCIINGDICGGCINVVKPILAPKVAAVDSTAPVVISPTSIAATCSTSPVEISPHSSNGRTRATLGVRGPGALTKCGSAALVCPPPLATRCPAGKKEHKSANESVWCRSISAEFTKYVAICQSVCFRKLLPLSFALPCAFVVVVGRSVGPTVVFVVHTS